MNFNAITNLKSIHVGEWNPKLNAWNPLYKTLVGAKLEVFYFKVLRTGQLSWICSKLTEPCLMCLAQAGTVCSLSGFAPLHPYANPLLVSKVAQKRTLKGIFPCKTQLRFVNKKSYNPLDCHSCAKFNPSGLNSCYALKQTAAWHCFIKHCLFQSAYGLPLLLSFLAFLFSFFLFLHFSICNFTIVFTKLWGCRGRWTELSLKKCTNKSSECSIKKKGWKKWKNVNKRNLQTKYFKKLK